MTRELERFFNGKINAYWKLNTSLDGSLSDSAERLINDFYKHTLNYPINSTKDVPEKFDPIIK